MAAPAPPARRSRRLWIGLAIAAAVVAVVVVGSFVAAALLGPAGTSVAPAPASSPAPAATPAPTPSPATGASAAADAAQQHKEYRAYVSTVLRGGVSTIFGLAGVEGCRTSRDECAARLEAASSQVAALQDGLAQTPAPACLTAADELLQDGLSLMRSGLDVARDAVEAQDRVRLAQGAVLTAAGLWRSGQGVVTARRSDC